MSFRAMVDMAETPQEIEKTDPVPAVVGSKPSLPIYPYGLCISLDERTLAKLGLDGDLPEVGEMIHLAAMAKVTSVSESERQDDKGNKTRCCRVELQITHLSTENEDDEEAAEQATSERRKRFYDTIEMDKG